jgi:uncharacterized protein YjbI with pentapeptide repeats
MVLSASDRNILRGILLFLVVAHPAMAQQADWTWKDRSGRVRTSADLRGILEKHKTWLYSKGISGKRADLSGANLVNANLSSADLSQANLDNAVFGQSKPLSSVLTVVNGNMMRATTFKIRVFPPPVCPSPIPDLPDSSYETANLIGTMLTGAAMNSANLTGVNLRSANLKSVQMENANLTEADLSSADLSGANLRHASLDWTQLFHANMNNTDLTDAYLANANLAFASVVDAELSGVDFTRVNVCGAQFEAKSIPLAPSFASAFSLESMTYDKNPLALVEARKQFRDGGFDAQDRKLTFAIKKRQEGELRQSCKDGDWLDCAGYAFNFVLFDLSCKYGMSPGIALRSGAVLWLLCSALYFVFIHIGGKTGLYRVSGKSLEQDSSARQRAERISPSRIRYTWGRLSFLQWAWRKFSLLRTAMFFSLMSAFNIGFREINFGRWLRLLTREEFDITAVGWARVVSGWQSLISVLLIALWVLTYFSRPFG